MFYIHLLDTKHGNASYALTMQPEVGKVNTESLLSLENVFSIAENISLFHYSYLLSRYTLRCMILQLKFLFIS